MKTMFRVLKAGVAITLLGLCLASLANAQCVNLGKYKKSALMLPQVFSAGQLMPAVSAAAAHPAQEEGGSLGAQQEPIVGFWYVKFTSQGWFSDWGYNQYHSDGSEILNSGSGARKFCLGVWKKTGPSTYEVNHFAIAYDYASPTPNFMGIVNIRETITMSSDHNTFTGTFTVGIYDQSGNLEDPPGTTTGQIEGHRITVNTPVTDVLPAI